MQEYNWLEEFNFLHFSSLDSTEKECQRIINRGHTEGYVVFAESVSSDQMYNAFGKNVISFSVILRTLHDVDSIKLLFIFSLAVGNTLQKFSHFYDAGLDVRYKWPNFILLDNKEIAAVYTSTHNKHNIMTATVKKTVRFSTENAILFLDSVMKELRNLEAQFMQYGFSFIKKLWMERASGFNSACSIECGKEKLIGTLEQIDDDGNLIMKLHDGRIHIISAAEIFYDMKIRGNSDVAGVTPFLR